MQQSAVAIIRLSGQDAVPIAQRVFRTGGGRQRGWQPESHRVYYGKAVGGDGAVLDEVPFFTDHELTDKPRLHSACGTNLQAASPACVRLRGAR